MNPEHRRLAKRIAEDVARPYVNREQRLGAQLNAHAAALAAITALTEGGEVGHALEIVADAAANWAHELRQYIAPGSEDWGDHESAAAQRAQADEIEAAIAALLAAIGEDA